MRTDWMGGVALLLSAATLAVVISIAVRPAPPSVDPGPALSELRYDLSEMQANIAALRSIPERPLATANLDPLAALQARFDSLDSAVSAIAARFSTLCTAINSSPFAPSGGAC
jgi:hypothetical protein